ncbi:rhodanese-related sulfurtransferase [Albidovulum inexpectatum]|uniref:Rhodanese-related sulfurtransferase n=1 Tax=Albidovulum inexpectatum TaxID=196587 RepID=A0A2S5JI80_9RHOB|nr:rhodanese-like domain-containing protein [Albidovulum inexpectatum]PPB80985.1 rhodanese-related sulfurtransferase [Albidovulum inexpectatum]
MRTVVKDLPEAREVCPTTSQLLLSEGALLVDVREPAEIAQVGYAGCDVVNIPLSQFEDRWQEIPRDRDVILACASGERSLKAAYFLIYQGYSRVMNMRPGIARWIERGFPFTGSAKAVAASEAASSCCGEPAKAADASCCGDGAEASSCC